jgi:murein DD-endopeptidase / murein LD-carboxypeptidase
MHFNPTFKAGFERYLGIPWVMGGASSSGCDCWGLVQIIYKAELGIVLEHASEMTSLAAANAARRVALVRELMLGEARLVPAAEPQDFDIVELAMAGEAADHVGLMAGGMLLHSRRNIGSHRVTVESVAHQVKGSWRIAL